ARRLRGLRAARASALTPESPAVVSAGLGVSPSRRTVVRYDGTCPARGCLAASLVPELSVATGSVSPVSTYPKVSLTLARQIAGPDRSSHGTERQDGHQGLERR